LAELEQIVGIAPKYLSCAFQKKPGIGDQPRHGEARVVDAIVTSDEGIRNDGTIRPRQDVVMERVDLPKSARIFPAFSNTPPGSAANVT
jgi:hypothetical protein